MRHMLEKSVAFAMDGAMCSMMNVLQWHRRDQVCSLEQFESYVADCSGISREAYYQMPPMSGASLTEKLWEWDSPRPSGFVENDRVRVHYHPCRQGPAAPTVLLLHALMSGSDRGYRRLARWYNERGWNVVFPHLPFHYSRTPQGHFNGLLAINANLIRNVETIRQCVIELRQLMSQLRSQGCREFALMGTSYGGWNGALLSFLEADFRFVALIQPIVNVEHAIWGNPGSATMRRLLLDRGFEPWGLGETVHLCSPLHGVPLCDGERTIITAGIYDRVSPAKELLALKHRWPGAKLLHVRQGHFGHLALRKTLEEIDHLI
jgi:hypothetical protein